MNTQQRIDTLNEITFRDIYKNISLSDERAEEAVRLSGEANYTKGLAWALLNTGLIRVEKVHFEEALQILRQSMRLFLDVNSRQGHIASLNSIGLCFIRMGKMKEAFHSLRDALNLNREYEYKTLEYSSLNYLGILQFKSDNFSHALKLFQKARPDNQTSILNNLGCTYRALGDSGQALLNLNNALVQAEKEGRMESQVAILEEIALVFGSMGVFEKGIATLQRALDMSSRFNYRSRPGLFIHMGDQFLKLGNFESAEDALHQALELIDDGNIVENRMVFRHLSTLFEHRGDYKHALEHQRRYHELSDSVKSSELEDLIWQLETEQLEVMNRKIRTVGEMGRRMTIGLDRDGIYRNLLSSLAELFRMDF